MNTFFILALALSCSFYYARILLAGAFGIFVYINDGSAIDIFMALLVGYGIAAFLGFVFAALAAITSEK